MSGYNTIFLSEGLRSFGLDAGTGQIDQFIKYYEILVEWNSFMNLTAITQFDEVVRKHFLDSVSLIKILPDLESEQYTIIDVGTGAGFPGIPLKIIFPHLKILLLDSLNKRINFLNEVIGRLNLKNVDTVHGRAEDCARDRQYREKYDLCVSRAVANLSTLSEYCLPFVKKGGCFVSYKSEKVTEEYERSKKAIVVLGGKCEKREEFYLPDTDIYRNLFLIRKVKNTPERYPRKAGIPQKEPMFL